MVPGLQDRGVPQMTSVVQCPNCFHVLTAGPVDLTPFFPYPSGVPYGFLSHGPVLQQPYPCPQQLLPHNSSQLNSNQPHLYGPPLYSLEHQQQMELATNTTGWRYVPQCEDSGNDVVHRIRDILIDILNTATCQYGVTITQLLALLKQACTNYNITLSSSITDDFKSFLQHRMADYVEVEDELYRYRRSKLSIRETDIPNPSFSERSVNRSKTPPVTLLKEKVLQRCASMPTVTKSENLEGMSTVQMKVSVTSREENFTYNSGALEVGQYEDSEQHTISDDADRTIMADPDSDSATEECSGSLSVHSSNASSLEEPQAEELVRAIKNWKETFTGDLKTLIRYLRMVDEKFQSSSFTLSQFKGCFGEALNKWWESWVIDFAMMDLIEVAQVTGLGEEPVLNVNPLVKKVTFHEINELARKVYKLLSKMLDSVETVKFEVVLRTLDFGGDSSKTKDEKYLLLWDMLSDPDFRDVFCVEVLQKQSRVRGFDVMLCLNRGLDLQRIFGE